MNVEPVTEEQYKQEQRGANRCAMCEENVPTTELVTAHIRQVEVGTAKGGYQILCGPIDRESDNTPAN